MLAWGFDPMGTHLLQVSDLTKQVEEMRNFQPDVVARAMKGIEGKLKAIRRDVQGFLSTDVKKFINTADRMKVSQELQGTVSAVLHLAPHSPIPPCANNALCKPLYLHPPFPVTQTTPCSDNTRRCPCTFWHQGFRGYWLEYRWVYLLWFGVV